jgi:hypothetical protein
MLTLPAVAWMLVGLMPLWLCGFWIRAYGVVRTRSALLYCLADASVGLAFLAGGILMVTGQVPAAFLAFYLGLLVAAQFGFLGFTLAAYVEYRRMGPLVRRTRGADRLRWRVPTCLAADEGHAPMSRAAGLFLALFLAGYAAFMLLLVRILPATWPRLLDTYRVVAASDVIIAVLAALIWGSRPDHGKGEDSGNQPER